MSQAELQHRAAGQFCLRGDLSFETVPGLVEAGEQLFAGADDVNLDLAGVGRSDSAGLALLVSWIRLARLHNKKLRLERLPAQLHGLAQVSGIEHLFSEDKA